MSRLTPSALRSPSFATLCVTAGVLLSPLFCGAAPAGLERIYQQALEDPEFKKADEELNAAYSQAMRSLPKPERDSLRQAERFWIRENNELLQQNTGKELELLKKRFIARRDELVRAQSAPTAAAATVVEKSAPPAEQPPALVPRSKRPQEAEAAKSPVPEATALKKTEVRGWSEKAAETLEKFYQEALKEPAFEEADALLRSSFKKALGVLESPDRDKLRVAEKAWVRENAVLVAAAGAPDALELLKTRTKKRLEEIETMLRERRFLPSGGEVASQPERALAATPAKTTAAIPAKPAQPALPALSMRDELPLPSLDKPAPPPTTTTPAPVPPPPPVAPTPATPSPTAAEISSETASSGFSKWLFWTLVTGGLGGLFFLRFLNASNASKGESQKPARPSNKPISGSQPSQATATAQTASLQAGVTNSASATKALHAESAPQAAELEVLASKKRAKPSKNTRRKKR